MIQKMLMSSGGGGGSEPINLLYCDIFTKVKDTKGTYSVNTSNAVISYGNTDGYSNAVTFYVYMDVTNVKKVIVDLNVTSTNGSFAEQKLAIASTTPNISVTETIVASTPISKTVGTNRYELDLSSYTGMYYVEVGVTALIGSMTLFALQ